MIKKVLIAIVVLGLAGGVFGYLQFNKEHRNIEEEAASLKVGAVELFDLYVSNEAEANALYLDKVIEVSGAVSEIVNDSDNHLLVLKTNDDFFGVNASFDNEMALAEVQVGAQIIIKGHCTGGDDMGVVFTHCSIIK